MSQRSFSTAVLIACVKSSSAAPARAASRAARSPLIIACTQGPHMLSIVALQERAPAGAAYLDARVLTAAYRAAKAAKKLSLAAC